jgi:hypothetical protein
MTNAQRLPQTLLKTQPPRELACILLPHCETEQQRFSCGKQPMNLRLASAPPALILLQAFFNYGREFTEVIATSGRTFF